MGAASTRTPGVRVPDTVESASRSATVADVRKRREAQPAAQRGYNRPVKNRMITISRMIPPAP
jgi:hypothetical protein